MSRPGQPRPSPLSQAGAAGGLQRPRKLRLRGENEGLGKALKAANSIFDLGDPHHPFPGGVSVSEPEARLWAKVDKTEDCWVWTESTA